MAWLFTNTRGLTGSTSNLRINLQDDISGFAVQLQCESSCLVMTYVVFAPFLALHSPVVRVF